MYFIFLYLFFSIYILKKIFLNVATVPAKCLFICTYCNICNNFTNKLKIIYTRITLQQDKVLNAYQVYTWKVSNRNIHILFKLSFCPSTKMQLYVEKKNCKSDFQVFDAKTFNHSRGRQRICHINAHSVQRARARCTQMSPKRASA